MKKDFENVKNAVRIEDVARHLLGEPVREMYRHPNEKSASIKIYGKTQSFFDFGRVVGGDCIRLWSHVCRCDSWTALKAIQSLYGLSDEPDRENIKQRIRRQEKAQEAAKQAEAERREAWRSEVDFWKRIFNACEKAIRETRPLSKNWCWAVNQRQIADYRLDDLFGIHR